MPFQYPEIISERLRTYKIHLRRFSESLDEADLFWKSGLPVKTALKEVATSLIKEIDIKIAELEAADEPWLKATLSRASVLGLEEFIHFGESLVKDIRYIQKDHRSVGKELYYFVQCVLDDFSAYPVTVVITTHTSLRTISFWEILKKTLEQFPDTKSLISSRRSASRIWIVQVPLSLLRNPLNWALVAHELGHIMEIEYIRIVDPAFALKADELKWFTPNVIRTHKRHAMEYQADLFASIVLGPVFAKILSMGPSGFSVGRFPTSGSPSVAENPPRT